MTSFRWRCRVAALLMAVAGPAWAEDGGHAASDCDILCRLQAYMAADHMVAFVPAEEAKSAVRPKKAARRAAAKTPKAALRKIAAGKAVAETTADGKAALPKTAIRGAAPPVAPTAAAPAPSVVPRHAEAARRNGPRSRLVAATRPPVPAPPRAVTPDTTAWQQPTLIPGGAPMMTTQFSPVQR